MNKSELLWIVAVNVICPNKIPDELKKKILKGTKVNYWKGFCECGYKPDHYIAQYFWKCDCCGEGYYT